MHNIHVSSYSHAIDQKGKDIIAIMDSTEKSHHAACAQLSGQIQRLDNNEHSKSNK